MNTFFKPNFEYSNEIHLSRMGGEGQGDNTKNPCTKKFLNCYLMIKKKINIIMTKLNTSVYENYHHQAR